MQVTTQSEDGLKREIKIVIDRGELKTKVAARLEQLKGQVRLKGFRPGKVPVDHLRRLYGRSVMAEVMQESVNEANEKTLKERNERLAVQPDVKFSEDEAEIERVFAGEQDLAFTVAYEVLPEIALADLSKLALERETSDVTEADVDREIAHLVEQSVSYEATAGRAAEDGDRVTIDYEGSIDGVPFEGGKGEGAQIVLGRGGFIPGFEEGLKGAKAGDSREVKATFPAEYQVKDLAGKAASFAVTVKEIGVPKKPAVDDAFAQNFGLESLAKLREVIANRVKREYDQVSRSKVKRQLLDELEKAHAFTLPAKLVDGELTAIMTQVTDALKRSGKTLADEGKSEEEAKADYAKIAERRVRLGLVLAEIGDKNKIAVSEDELRRAMLEEARRYPGQEKRVLDYFKKNPQAVMQLRAPIYEDKVVDFVLELAKPKEKKVSREELLKRPDDEEEVAPGARDSYGRLPGDPHYGHNHGPEHDHHPG
jgi:trigger factor